MTNTKIIKCGAYAAPYDDLIKKHRETNFLTEKQFAVLQKQALKFESVDLVEINDGQILNILMKFEKLSAAEKAHNGLHAGGNEID